MRAFPLIAGGIATATVLVGTMVQHMFSARGAVVSPDELAAHDSRSGSPWLSILGHVFDVSSGSKFYGEGGSYSFFAGRDATRAFVTGDFANDLHDDIQDLSPDQVAGLFRWMEDTFRAKYSLVGVLEGTFFAGGSPTQAFREALARKDEAASLSRARASLESRFPTCSSSWRQDVGGWRYCEDAARRPRRVRVDDGSAEFRCGCVVPSEGDPALVKPWDGCPPDAARCPIPP